MAKGKHSKRKFSGMDYREVQRSNSTRRNQLSKAQQTWLKQNGYKNRGWDNVIRLYQKLNELLAFPEGDEPTLEELFLEADRIGNKYQTREEINAFQQQMATEVNAIADLVEQQFPETEGEVIHFSTQASRQSKRTRSRS